jgi:thioredoxin 1
MAEGSVTLTLSVGRSPSDGVSSNVETERAMATKDLTTSEFAEVTGGEGIVLVDFWADWCGPCKRFAPVYERVSDKHPDVVFAKVDTEAEPSLMYEFQIQAIPTLMAIRDGVLVFQQSGALPESALESLIGQVRALDMDEIRASAEAA